MEGSILESIGVEIIDVMSPVSICMLLVVLFVYALSPSSPSPYSTSIRTAANLVYLETPSDSAAEKLEGSLLNALVFVVLIAVVTFILVALYYYNFTNCLIYYMRFSTFFVLATMGGGIFLSIIQHFSIPIDSITCFLLLFNFTVVGVLSVFSGGIPIVLRQGYMVSLGIIVAAWFTKLPEWTTWTLLVALALYDLVAVLAPGGPLKLLVDMASSRDEDLPALVYEARPTASSRPRGSALDLLVAGASDSASIELQAVSRGNADQNEIALGNRGNPEYNAVEVGHVRARRVTALDLLFSGVSDSVSTELQAVSRGNADQNEIALGNRGNPEPEYTAVEVGHIRAEERGSERDEDERSPLMISSRERESSSSESSQYSTMNVLPNRTRQYGSRELEIVVNEEMSPLVELMGREQMQRESSLPEITPGIKLGLGDFVFYSVLVGRAAMYDLMTVYACYLAIISGLGCTLILLSVCHRALPALPISIALGTMFYFLTRLLMEPFVVGTATNLMMF